MEEDILGKLNENLRLDGEYIDYESKKIAAKEITEHVFEFILWLLWEKNPISIEGDEDGNPIFAKHDEKFNHVGVFMDIEEVYQFWWNEVKK
jgi:hypothetical protein